MRRTARLAAEALHAALAQPVTTAVTVLVLAGVSSIITATLGQTVALEDQVLARIDEAGPRTIVVEDVDGSGELDPSVVDRFSALSGVEWAIGFGIATDVRPRGIDGGTAVPIRRYFGTLPDVVAKANWHAEPGTAIAGREALRELAFSAAAGPVVQTTANVDLGVVGPMRADAPLDFLNRSLITAPTASEPLVRVYVLARSAGEVASVAGAMRTVLGTDQRASVAIKTSDSIAELRAAIQGQLGSFGRSIVGGTLLAGLIVLALVIFGAVATRRREFGRRRALGASQFDVMVLLLMQVVMTSLIGSIVGVGIGTLIAVQIAHTAPDIEFAIAVAILATCSTVVAAGPPAALAALQDPVRILRVP